VQLLEFYPEPAPSHCLLLTATEPVHVMLMSDQHLVAESGCLLQHAAQFLLLLLLLLCCCCCCAGGHADQS
jgi:hypothetical protein